MSFGSAMELVHYTSAQQVKLGLNGHRCHTKAVAVQSVVAGPMLFGVV